MKCRICKKDIGNEDAQHHLDVHIAQHASGQKPQSIRTLDGNSTEVPDSAMAAFVDFSAGDTADNLRKNHMLTKLFV